MMIKGKKWTLEEDRQLKGAINEKVWPKQIAIDLGRDVRSVYQRMIRLGLTLHNFDRQPLLEIKLHLTMEEGEKLKDLAAAQGLYRARYLQKLVREHLKGLS